MFEKIILKFNHKTKKYKYINQLSLFVRIDKHPHINLPS